MSRSISKTIFAVVFFTLSASAQTPPATAPTPPRASPQPVPDVALLANAQEMIHKLYASDFANTAPTARRALARTLLRQGGSTPDDAPARYVALSDAVELAASTGDAPTAIAAATQLARTFTVDGLELRRNALVRAHASASVPDDCEAVMRLALETADQAAAVDAFEIVEQLVNVAEAAANKTRQVKTVASIQTKLAALRELTAEFAQAKAAFARLVKDDSDAESHLVIGRFYALHKGQWTIGLPHLAAGSNEELRALAAKELARPADGLGQAAIADGWWEYAEKASGTTQAVVKAHATDLYKNARAALQGITLARIDSRIAGGKEPAANAAAASGAAFDLLAGVDPAKDAAQGSWSRGGNGIVCDSSAYACLRLQHAVPEQYDLRVSFTRTEGKGAVAVLLAEGKKSFGFALDVSGNARFENVDGKAAKDNPTVVPVAVSNGQRYELTVEVRKDQVRALLDGKELVTHKTDYKDLSRYSVWKLGDNVVCGIGANNAKVTFHTIEMVEVGGK